jgi:hypothetical protein
MRFRNGLLLVATCAALTVAACSGGGGTSAPGEGDSGSGGSSGASASGGSSGSGVGPCAGDGGDPDAGMCTGASCNNVVNSACAVGDNYSTDALPTFTGGTITDGTYYLTKATISAGLFGGTGVTSYATLVVSGGGTMAQGAFDDVNGIGCRRGTVALAASSIDLAITPTCGDQLFDSNMKNIAAKYTATPTTLVLSFPTAGGGGTWVQTFAKE